MELIIPQNVIDFDFHSARTSPHVSPPLTPRRFGDQSYFSAPTSPSRAAKIYGEYDEPIEFDFQFCGGMEMGNIFSSADDLFDGGKIRPMKTLPKSERIFKDSASGTSFKPSKGNETEQSSPGMKKHIDASDQRRGRAFDSHMSNSHKTAARSLYPLPVADPQPRDITKASESSSTLLFGKWKLRDFLLFRSASEGRASDKYPLKKFEALRKKDQEDGKSSSFRSVDSFGSDQSASRRKIQMSAHELHYTKNKAASESLKKKTYLPYKQGILGRLF